MKTHLKSDGKYFPIIGSTSYLICTGLLLISAGCQTGEKSSSVEDNPALLAEQVSDEVSLESDRSELDSLRGDISGEKKQSNDELAMDLELMAQAQKPPHEIRSQFQARVRKLRAQFREKTQKVRTQFRDVQTKQREAHLAKLKTEREEFKEQKPDREKSKAFYDAQDLQRRDFFAKQKEQRQEFESELNQKNKDFNANMKLRIEQFEEQLRLYSKKRTEEERQAREAKKNAAETGASGASFSSDQKLDLETKKIMEEFEQMKSIPSEKIGD